VREAKFHLVGIAGVLFEQACGVDELAKGLQE
jgi:hypothetical protein